MANFDQTTQLLLLKTMTIRTGSLHEAQLLQLKLWPRMIIGTTRKTRTEVDQDSHLISFHLGTSSKFKLDDSTKALMKEIVSWVRFILWDDTAVVFVAKKQNVYDTRTERRDAGTGAAS